MERIDICYRCGIYDSTRKLCDGQLFLNPKTNDVRSSPRDGYIKGCSCYIPRKVLNPKAKCPAGKW